MTRHYERRNSYPGCACPPLLAAVVVLCGLGAPGAYASAKWTIRCAEFDGSARIEAAEQITGALKRAAGIRAKNVFYRDGSDGVVRVYYGNYHRPTDRKTGKRPMPRKMKADLDLLRGGVIVDDSGRRFVLTAIPVRIPVTDVGNPAWNLRHVRGAYSLQVAAFEPTDKFSNFKKAAAEYCAHLRKRGYEAYYYHTEVNSVVTVGVFGPEATHRGMDGRMYYNRAVAKNSSSTTSPTVRSFACASTSIH